MNSLLSGVLSAAFRAGQKAAWRDRRAAGFKAPRNPFTAESPSWSMRRLAVAWWHGYESVYPAFRDLGAGADTDLTWPPPKRADS